MRADPTSPVGFAGIVPIALTAFEIARLVALMTPRIPEAERIRRGLHVMVATLPPGPRPGLPPAPQPGPGKKERGGPAITNPTPNYSEHPDLQLKGQIRHVTCGDASGGAAEAFL